MAKRPIKAKAIAAAIDDRDTAELFTGNYLEYGRLTLEDRALPDYRDGLLKVYRRTLWAMHNVAKADKPHVKTARVVGDTLGKYHPHGDRPVADAVEVMVWMPQAPVSGDGNWGGQNDSAAAMRYCFVGSTRVVTSKGLLSFDELAKMYALPSKFSDVEVTDLEVASLHGPETASHLLNSGLQDTVRLTASGYSTQCTPNEPFYVITPNGYRWIDAQHLRPGDVICMSRNTGMDFHDASFTNESLAVVLGYLVGDGYLNRGQRHIGFNQVDVPTFEDFLNYWRASVPFEFTTRIRPASSYGQRDYHQFYCNSMEAIEWFASLGLRQGDSYDREIPTCIWSGTRTVMAKFLSALFEADGSISNAGRGSSTIQLSSVSRKLIDDVSLMLRSVFGIFATEHTYASGEIRLLINGVENLRRFAEIGFRSERRQPIVIQEKGKSNFDRIPHAASLGFSRGYSFTQRETFRKKYEHGEYSSRAAQAIYERDYFYATVESVQPAGPTMVYDLTVPTTHAFVADGFIVHNTNCRLSEYAATYLLHKDYLPTIKLHPNYDGKDMEPELLPALLPNAILNGASGVGLGLNTTVPAFALPGVVTLLKGMLKGRKLTTAAAYKHLEFVFPYGGWVPKGEWNQEGFEAILTTGKGSVYVCCDYEIPDEQHIRITGVPPRMNLDKLLASLRDTGLFTTVQDAYGRESTTPADILCTCKRGNKASRVIDQLLDESFFYSKVPFQMAVVERRWDEQARKIVADIHQWGVIELLENWLKWRIELEGQMLDAKVGSLDAETLRKNLLLLAQENRKVIAASWEADDQTAYLMTKLKISKEDADYVCSLRNSQLAKLDRAKLTAELKALATAVKDVKAQRKDLPGSVLARL